MRGHIHFDDLCKYSRMWKSYSSALAQGGLESEIYPVMDSLEMARFTFSMSTIYFFVAPMQFGVYQQGMVFFKFSSRHCGVM